MAPNPMNLWGLVTSMAPDVGQRSWETLVCEVETADRLATSKVPRTNRHVEHEKPMNKSTTYYLAVLKAKIKIKNPRNRAGIDPKPMMSLRKW